MTDSFLDSYGGVKSGTFYSIERSDFDFSAEFFGQIFACSFVIDSNEDYYERRVYNFFDFTGQLGGLYEIIAIIGGIFVSFFADKILVLSLMSSLYQVESQKQADDPPQQTQTFKISKVSPVNHMFEEEKTPQTLHKKQNFGDSWDDVNKELDEQHSELEENSMLFCFCNF